MKNTNGATAIKQEKRKITFPIKNILWVVLGFVAGLGNMMMEISPFAAALCAAVPMEYLFPTMLGGCAGSLLLSQIMTFQAGMLMTFRYVASVALAAVFRKMFDTVRRSDGSEIFPEWASQLEAPAAALGAMLLPSTAAFLAAPFDRYALSMAAAEAVLSASCAYFLQKTIQIFSMRQGMLDMKRADLISVVMSVVMVMISLSNVTLGGISLGRLTASIVVLLCALLGKESWGAISGVICGSAVSLAMFPKVHLAGIYGAAGLSAGIFSSFGKFGCAMGFALVFGTLSAMVSPPPITPLMIETLVTAAGLMFLPNRLLQKAQKVFCRPDAAEESSVRQLMLERLEDAAGALQEISWTTQAVSKKLNQMKAGSLDQVYDQAIDAVCLKCGLKNRCWQQEYGDTIQVFNHLTEVLRNNGSVCQEDFIYPLCVRCNHRDQLCRYINQGYQQLTVKEGLSRKVARVRAVVTDQFSGLSQLLEGLSQEMCSISGYEEQTAKRVRDYLSESSYRFQRVNCYRDEEGRNFLQLDCDDLRAERLDLEQMARELSRVCDCDFDFPRKRKVCISNKEIIRLLFREKAEYQAEYAVTQHICQGYRMCGDACGNFTDSRSVHHIILSDGMGSGTAAAVDSNMTVSLLTRLIDAGVSYPAALKIVNSALLVKSGEESLSTVDVTAINLYTGQARFYKAGAAPTFVRRGKKVLMLESVSFPAGILTSVEFDENCLKLSEGDLVVMVSDGATASGEEWIKNVIAHFPEGENLQELCNDIVSTAKLRRNDAHDDDITAAACRICKSEIDMI